MTIHRRWAAGIEYLGSRYCGWQRQDEGISVQSELERALSQVADQPVTTVAAGRTDAGVHAFQQVVHFDCAAHRSAYGWLLGTNRYLPPDISVRWMQEVAEGFHARYSAMERSYRYVFHTAAGRSALLSERVAWVTRPLDVTAMNRAAQALVGEHDFTAFRDSQCQSPSPMRHLRRILVRAMAEFVTIDVTANAFLHHMVRNIAGTLLQVGQGKQPESWVGEVLASRQRVRAGMTAVAQGLYFVGPAYPAEFRLPVPVSPWFPTHETHSN